MKPERVLRTLAELAKQAPEFPTNVIGQQRDFEWFHPDSARVFDGRPIRVRPLSSRRSDDVRRLLAVGALHRTEQLLRIGWIWIAGTIDVDVPGDGSKRERYCLPLMSIPVSSLDETRDSAKEWLSAMVNDRVGIKEDWSNVLEAVGDAELTRFIQDRSERDQLSQSVDWGAEGFATDPDAHPGPFTGAPALESWCERAVDALGINVDEWLAPGDGNPPKRSDEEGLVGFVGAALYAHQAPTTDTESGALLNLALTPGLTRSAFAKLYRNDEVDEGTINPVTPVRPLTLRQSSVASRAGAADLAGISGAPGTGKTHVLSTIAVDAVARGQSVLVVGSSPYSVDVFLEHLETIGSVPPVPFGSSRHSQRLSSTFSMLAAGESVRAGETTPRNAALLEEWSALQMRIGRQVAVEAEFAQAQHLQAGGGLSLDGDLNALFSLTEQCAIVRARMIAQFSADRLSEAQRAGLARIAGALLSNRFTRAQIFLEDPELFISAAPLWVGTALDALELLPRVAGLFDLVIIDEAALASQPSVAGALVRATRAVICGDPNQLGLRSFVSENQLQDATALFDTDPYVLDIRTNSVFDVAAQRVPVEVLDEHFRSVPHLIEFSARRFYGGELTTATRHPANEASDHIQIEIVPDGVRTGPKSGRINTVEVERCLAMVDELVAAGWRSIGLVTPFRAQADALEAALVDTYSVQQIQEFGLGVGTVHAFQGDERDVMILSFSVGHDEPAKAWEFVNQETLFNVMVTRAKYGVVVVTSNPAPPGLAGDYIRWAEPMAPLGEVAIDHEWVEEVATALNEHGVPVRASYRVGRHRIDLVAGTGASAVAIECLPHPDGVDAHLDRAMLLRRARWQTADAFASHWRGRTAEFAIEFAGRFPDIVSSD